MGFDAPVPKPKLTRDRALFELQGTVAAESFEPLAHHVDLEDIYARLDSVVPPEEWPKLEPIARWLAEQGVDDATSAANTWCSIDFFGTHLNCLRAFFIAASALAASSTPCSASQRAIGSSFGHSSGGTTLSSRA